MSDTIVSNSHTLYDVTKDIIIPLFGSLLTFIGLMVAIFTFRSSLKIARANFEMQMTMSHRDIWRYINSQNLTRISDSNADPSTITDDERLNISFVLIHVQNVYSATKDNVIEKPENQTLFMKDVGEFFSLPLPYAVWQSLKGYYNEDFQDFILESQILHSEKNN